MLKECKVIKNIFMAKEKVVSIKIWYIVFALLMILVIYSKKDYHVDELMRYALANSGSINMPASMADGYVYEPADTAYISCLSVNESDRFNYAKVWKAQTSDTHPPLYYALLHTVCSFFPNTFSKWYAGIINIFFGILTLWALQKLIRLFCEDIFILHITSILFVFSAGILSAVSFLNIYTTAMFWVTLIAYFFAWKIVAGREESSLKQYIILALISGLSALTHYYCIVYLVASCAVFGIYLIVHKKWKQMIGFISTMGLAAAFSIMVFPAMIDHLFLGSAGSRAPEALNNLTGMSGSGYLSRIKLYFSIVDNQLFGGILLQILLFLVLVRLYKSVLPNSQCIDGEIQKDKQSLRVWGMSALIVPLIIYFFVISRTAIYEQDRYMMPIYAVLLGAGTVAFYYLTRKFINYKSIRILSLLICVFLTVHTWKNFRLHYLYNDNGRFEKAESYHYMDAVFVYDSFYRTLPAFVETSYYKSLTFIHSGKMEMLDEYKYKNSKEILLLVTSGDDSILKTVMDKFPYVDQYEKIDSCYHPTYRLYGSGRDYIISTYDNSAYLGGQAQEDGYFHAVLTNQENVIYITKNDNSYNSLLLEGKALDIYMGVICNQRDVLFYKPNDTLAQKWELVKNEDGSYTFLSVDSQYCLAYDSSGRVFLSRRTGNNNEKWVLKEVEK